MDEYLLAVLQIFCIWQEKIENVIPSIPLGFAGVTCPKEASKVMETNSQKYGRVRLNFSGVYKW